MPDQDAFAHGYPIKGFKMYYLREAVSATTRSPLPLLSIIKAPSVFWESRQLPFPNQQQSLCRRVGRWKQCLRLINGWDHHFIKSFLSTQKCAKTEASQIEAAAMAASRKPAFPSLPEQAISSPVMLALLGESYHHASKVYFV